MASWGDVVKPCVTKEARGFCTFCAESFGHFDDQHCNHTCSQRWLQAASTCHRTACFCSSDALLHMWLRCGEFDRCRAFSVAVQEDQRAGVHALSLSECFIKMSESVQKVEFRSWCQICKAKKTWIYLLNLGFHGVATAFALIHPDICTLGMKLRTICLQPSVVSMPNWWGDKRKNENWSTRGFGQRMSYARGVWV